MANNTSTAPKERVNIVYQPSSGDTEESVELPLKQLVLGNFSNRQDERRLEDRESISIDKDNFNDVLKAHKVSVDFAVPNTLSEEPDAEMSVSLTFDSMKDFGPEAVARKVPELDALLKLREALMALKGPLSNVPEFRKKIQQLIDDESQRDALLAELGLEKE